MDKIEILHEMCETILKSLEDANSRVRSSGGKLSASDVDYVDKLTHAMKSLKTSIAMMEAEEEGGYSGRYVYMPRYSGISDATHMGPGTGSYADGSYRSYAQDYSGRRDRMGRFTSRDGGYSYNGSMQSAIEELRGLMGEMPDEKRREVQRFIDKMERM